MDQLNHEEPSLSPQSDWSGLQREPSRQPPQPGLSSNEYGEAEIAAYAAKDSRDRAADARAAIARSANRSALGKIDQFRPNNLKLARQARLADQRADKIEAASLAASEQLIRLFEAPAFRGYIQALLDSGTQTDNNFYNEIKALSTTNPAQLAADLARHTTTLSPEAQLILEAGRTELTFGYESDTLDLPGFDPTANTAEVAENFGSAFRHLGIIGIQPSTPIPSDANFLIKTTTHHGNIPPLPHVAVRLDMTGGRWSSSGEDSVYIPASAKLKFSHTHK